MARRVVWLLAIPFIVFAGSDNRGSVHGPRTYPRVVPSEPLSSLIIIKLRTDVFRLKSKVTEFLYVANNVDSEIKEFLSALEKIDHTAKDLKEFDNTLTEVHRLLEIAKLVPEIGEAASALDKGIEAIQPEVHKVSEAVNKANAELKPAREDISRFEVSLSNAIQQAQRFSTELDAYVQAIIETQECIEKMRDQQKKETLQRDLEELATASDQTVVRTTQVLTAILGSFKTIVSSANPLVIAAFEDIRNQDGMITSKVTALERTLEPLNKVNGMWNKKFSVSFPYPDPKRGDPDHTGHYRISFSYKEIIKGVDHIEREFERLLSKTLYKAANKFGLGKLTDKLRDEADRWRKWATWSLDMDVKLALPELGRLTSDISTVRSAYMKVNGAMSKDPTEFIEDMNSLKSDADKLKTIRSSCS